MLTFSVLILYFNIYILIFNLYNKTFHYHILLSNNNKYSMFQYVEIVS